MEQLACQARVMLESDREILVHERGYYAERYGRMFTDEEWADERSVARRLVDRDLDNTARIALAAYREAVA
jgi:hypothetical protein